MLHCQWGITIAHCPGPGSTYQEKHSNKRFHSRASTTLPNNSRKLTIHFGRFQFLSTMLSSTMGRTTVSTVAEPSSTTHDACSSASFNRIPKSYWWANLWSTIYQPNTPVPGEADNRLAWRGSWRNQCLWSRRREGKGTGNTFIHQRVNNNNNRTYIALWPHSVTGGKAW